MEIITSAYEIKKENIGEHTRNFNLDDFFWTKEKKVVTEIGLIYITPYQVMQAYGINMNHDRIIEAIERNILDNNVTSKVFLRLYRIDIPGEGIKDAFGWDFDLMHSANIDRVKAITRDMYDLALSTQNLIIKMFQSRNIKLDEDLCVFIDDIRKEKGIRLVNDRNQLSNSNVEVVYGYRLSEYMQIIKQQNEKYSQGIAH